MSPAAVDAARPARFWQRATAWSLDALVPGAIAILLSWPLLAPALRRLSAVTDAVLHDLAAAMAGVLHAQLGGGTELSALPFLVLPATLEASARLTPAVCAVSWPPVAAFAGLLVLWHGGFEATHRQAAPGKRLLGLRVTDDAGRPPGIARAFARQLAGSLSWLTLNLGHLMAMAGPEHRTLHDRVGGARVLATRSGLPGWAWPWLLLAITVPALATGWLLLRVAARLQYLLDQAFWY